MSPAATVPRPPQADAPRCERRRRRAALAAVVVAGVVQRAYHCWDRSVFHDEVCSARMSQFAWHELYGRLYQDNHPPLYFVLLKLWTAVFGLSVLAMRGLSLVFAAAGIVAASTLATEIGSAAPGGDGATPTRPALRPDSAGLIAAGLVAVSPLQAFHGSQIRMYPLFTLLSLASSVALLRALRAGRGWPRYACAATLLLYTHYFALFIVAAQFAFALGLQRRRPRDRGVALAYAAIAIAWVPWLPAFLHQRSQVGDVWFMPALTPWSAVTSWFSLAWPVLASAPGTPMAPPAPAVVASGALGLACALAALARSRSVYQRFVCLPIALPFLLGAGVSLFGRQNILAYRYLFPSQAFVAVAAALLIAGIRPPALRTGFAAAALLAYVGRTLTYVDHIDVTHRPDAPAVAAYLQRQLRADDAAVFHSYEYFSVSFYASPRRDWFLYVGDALERLPHYTGRAMLTARDRLITTHELATVTARQLYVVDNSSRNLRVPPPAGWMARETVRFARAYLPGAFTHVTRYERAPGVTIARGAQ